MRRLPARLALLVIPLAFALPAACGDGYEVRPCGQIPEKGCPVGRGGTCDDATCAALYDCVDGAWRRAETCPGGGQDPDAGVSPDGCAKPVIDRTGETTGCMPDLQNPDCPAVAAEQCFETVCLTDCIDFFLCTEEGWNLVAYCNEEGTLELTQ